MPVFSRADDDRTAAAEGSVTGEGLCEYPSPAREKKSCERGQLLFSDH